MRTRPTYSWFAKVLGMRLFVVQVVLLAVFELDLTRPVLLLFYAGLLVGAYLVWLTLQTAEECASARPDALWLP